MGLDLLKIENLGIEKIIRRGTAEILERDDDGIFVYDTVSKIYMVSSPDIEKAESWILKHAKRGYEMFAVTGKPVADFIIRHFAFKNTLECHQIAYLKKDVEPSESDLVIRSATPDDLQFIMANYDLLNEEELKTVIRNGKMLLGEFNGKPAGFIGEHLEGSMGILFVLPEYRKLGFATCLEKCLMKQMISDGYTPFGQVISGNEKSLNLQKKLGFMEGDEYVYWIF